MIDRTKLIAFWLLPAAPARQFFRSLIVELAARFDAPVFEPHLTLLGGIANHERALRALREVSVKTRCELRIEGVHFSERFTQTLFVRFYLSDELRRLSRVFAQALDLESGDDFDPHVSLLYKDMPVADKKELAGWIKISFEQASFEGLKLIAHPPTITTRADVEAWREIDQRCEHSEL